MPGLAAARARGRRKRLGEEQRRHAVELYRSRQHAVKEICALVGISRSTLYAAVEEFAESGAAAAQGRRFGVRAVERSRGTSPR